MSGQPVRTPTDASKFRDAYVADLDLRIANDEKNLQANLLHKRTGQVASQITDYSTTTQKLSNIYALRIELKKQLRRICDAENSDYVVQQLTDDQVRFAIQAIEKIVSELRPKFKYGALAPEVLNYIRRLQAVETTTFGQPVNTLDDIARLLRQLPKASDLEDTKRLMVDLSSRTGDEYLRPIRDDLEQTKIMIDCAGEILASLRDKPGSVDPTLLPAVNDIVRDALGEMPTRGQIVDILQRMDLGQGDADFVKGQLRELHQMLSQRPEDVRQLQEALEGVQSQIGGVSKGQERLAQQLSQSSRKTTDMIAALEDRLNVKLNAQQLSLVAELSAAGASLAQILDRLAALEEGESLPIAEASLVRGRPRAGRAPSPETLPEPPNTEALFTGRKLSAPMSRLVEQYIPILEANGVELPVAKTFANYREWYRLNLPAIRQAYEMSQKRAEPAAGGAEATGSGLKKIKGKGVQVDDSKGVKEELKFAPFGRYLINLVKLNDDIIRVCRPRSGANVADVKTQRVSLELANVIRKMVNGGKPSFNDLSALSVADKQKYNEYLRKCHIVGDGIEVPRVNEREDLNQFEIMKGEILSGNDSTELIKKFKTLIIKLVHNERLPKSEAKDLLMDLATLGY